jgi:hypothetical protein
MAQQQVGHSVPDHCDGQCDGRFKSWNAQDLGTVQEQEITKRVVLDAKRSRGGSVTPKHGFFPKFLGRHCFTPLQIKPAIRRLTSAENGPDDALITRIIPIVKANVTETMTNQVQV